MQEFGPLLQSCKFPSPPLLLVNFRTDSPVVCEWDRGLIDDIPSCEKLLKRMEREAEEILLGSAKKVTKGGNNKRESHL